MMIAAIATSDSVTGTLAADRGHTIYQWVLYMAEVDDRRYRILVMLRKSDRIKYYDFHCFLCQMKVVELSGSDVHVFDDTADVYIKTTKGVRCPGRYRGGHCHAWYYFEDIQ